MGIGYNEGTVRIADLDASILIERQVIYDATMYTIPSAAWSQITDISRFNLNDPLDRQRVELAISGHLALGIAVSVYDLNTNPGLVDILTRWTAWYKQYRELLATGDVIHVKRPNGQGLDIVLRARAGLQVPGILVVTNPTGSDIKVQALAAPLYYSGLPPLSKARVDWSDGTNMTVVLDNRSRAALPQLVVPQRTTAWAIVYPAP